MARRPRIPQLTTTCRSASGAALAAVALVLTCTAIAAAGEPPAASGAPSGRPAAIEPAPPREEATPRQIAQIAFQKAEQAARDLRFAEALAAYEEAATRDPSAPFAPTARVRAADLRAHSEGAFVPLATLEAIRRDPAKNRDPAAIAALEEAARGFPDGRVRAEARLVVAQAYAHSFEDPARALAALESILTDPHADRATRTLALSEAITQYRVVGDLAGALAAVERDPDLLPTLTREVRTEVRRVKIARGCLVALGLLAAAALWGAARAVRRLKDVRKLAPALLRPNALAFAFYLGATGALFVRFRGGEGDPMPFLGLGLGVAIVVVLVRSWAAGEEGRSPARAALRAMLGAIGVLALAYLILWRSGGDYLKPLGL